MIIESVRSMAVPEEGRPYRKIKVSADAKTKLAPEVIRDAVSTYVREKVNHIVRGDCVVEVHWNGLDLRTLHLRSVQPLSPEEADRQRKESAARISQGGARVAAPSNLTTTELKNVVSAPLRLSQPASYLLVPSSATQTSTSSGVTQSFPIQISANGKPDAAQTKLRVVTINRKVDGPLNVPVPVQAGTSVNRLSVRPQSQPTLSVGQKIHIGRVRLIVSATPENVSATKPAQSVATSVAGPLHPGPVIRKLRAPLPGFIPPPGSRIIRMRATRPAAPVLYQVPTPSGNIRPSNTWSAQTASRDAEVVIQPTIAPTRVPVIQFAAPQIAQPLATIAPVLTVRQVAASNSNLNVRINGSVIRAVPGQVIRRVTGEIVRVLDNGSLEPVDMQPPPKAIMSSRDKPISLDSDSEVSVSAPASSSDPDFEITKTDRRPRRARPGRRRIPSGEVSQKTELFDEDSADSSRDPVEPVASPESDCDAEAYDPELLTPAVDFSEGEPFAEARIEQFRSQSAVPRKSRTAPLFPDLTEAMIVDDDGEMTLDPDLFEDYINRLLIRFGYLKAPKPVDSIAYLFLRRPKPKSQCVRYVPVANPNVLGSANIARHLESLSDHSPTSSDSEDAEPLRKRMRCQRRRRTSQELLLDACSSRKTNAEHEKDDNAPQVRPRTRKVQGIRMTHPGNIEEKAPSAPELTSDEPQPSPMMYSFKGVRVSEPIECFDSFVVMDRLKAPKNNQTVPLDGLLRSRSGMPLFEMREGDLFFNLRHDRVNRNAKSRFDSLLNPLRPIKDPIRGKLVAKMALYGIPEQPSRSLSLQKVIEPPTGSDSLIPDSISSVDLTNLKSESNHKNQRTVEFERSNEHTS